MKRSKFGDVGCYNCGTTGRYKNDNPDLLTEEKQERLSGPKTQSSRAQAKSKEHQIDQPLHHSKNQNVVGQALSVEFKCHGAKKPNCFVMSMDEPDVYSATHDHRRWTSTTQGIGSLKLKRSEAPTKKNIIANFTAPGGVAESDKWYSRLGHTCHQIQTPNEKKNDQLPCLSFRKAKAQAIPVKSRSWGRQNLLIQGSHNRTQYTTGLDFMDDYSSSPPHTY
ncbi:hypothetical protein PHMEG_0001656 [Phytophthora megakarya]|uniref:Uncharacterized protein n=1 Tax=Phytophthora megakarya TaxID=4795 RepID=A0A225X2K4_9STRA|nr:hypothetical protein PHMEG_0001656 [Phytophthora megakarya]